jgi:hypothetical protein
MPGRAKAEQVRIFLHPPDFSIIPTDRLTKSLQNQPTTMFPIGTLRHGCEGTKPLRGLGMNHGTKGIYDASPVQRAICTSPVGATFPILKEHPILNVCP